MAARSRNRSAVKATAGRAGMDIQLHITVEGVGRTDADFKGIRRDVNGRMREVMQRVGQGKALPAARSAFPSRKFAGTLYVQRERSGVFIGSRARGTLNRAVGWLDFGGRRPHDSDARVGPYTLVRTLDRLRPEIDAAILRELEHEFSRSFEVT